MTWLWQIAGAAVLVELAAVLLACLIVAGIDRLAGKPR